MSKTTRTLISGQAAIDHAAKTGTALYRRVNVTENSIGYSDQISLDIARRDIEHGVDPEKIIALDGDDCLDRFICISASGHWGRGADAEIAKAACRRSGGKVGVRDRWLVKMAPEGARDVRADSYGSIRWELDSRMTDAELEAHDNRCVYVIKHNID